MRIITTVYITFLFIRMLDLCVIKGQEISCSRSTIKPVPDNIIHVSTFVVLPPAEAFEYFTSESLLQSWLPEVAEFETRVSRKYELFWRPDDRENTSMIGCWVTVFTPGQLIAFQWRSPKQFKSFANSADPLTHVVVMFVLEDCDMRIHLIHSGWWSSPVWEEARL